MDIPEEGEVPDTARQFRSMTNSSRGSSGRGSSTGGDHKETNMDGIAKKKNAEEGDVENKGNQIHTVCKNLLQSYFSFAKSLFQVKVIVT